MSSFVAPPVRRCHVALPSSFPENLNIAPIFLVLVLRLLNLCLVETRKSTSFAKEISRLFTTAPLKRNSSDRSSPADLRPPSSMLLGLNSSVPTLVLSLLKEGGRPFRFHLTPFSVGVVVLMLSLFFSPGCVMVVFILKNFFCPFTRKRESELTPGFLNVLFLFFL